MSNKPTAWVYSDEPAPGVNYRFTLVGPNAVEVLRMPEGKGLFVTVSMTLDKVPEHVVQQLLQHN